MTVIIKKSNANPEIIEVSGYEEIGKLVGNIEKDGKGRLPSSDSRISIGKEIDLHMNELACIKDDLEPNIILDNFSSVRGTIICASCDLKTGKLISLTKEKIDYCLNYLENRKALY